MDELYDYGDYISVSFLNKKETRSEEKIIDRGKTEEHC